MKYNKLTSIILASSLLVCGTGCGSKPNTDTSVVSELDTSQAISSTKSSTEASTEESNEASTESSTESSTEASTESSTESTETNADDTMDVEVSVEDTDKTSDSEKEELEIKQIRSRYKFYMSTFDDLLNSNNGNVVYSPYSTHSMLALALMSMNPVSDAYQHTSKILNIEDFDKYIRAMKYENEGFSSKGDVTITNSVWSDISNKDRLADGYPEELKLYMNADVKLRDMTSQKFVDDINDYIDKNTDGMIKNVFSEPFKDHNSAVLMNTVLMDSKWEEGTFKDDLVDGKFNNKDMQMMQSSGYNINNYKNSNGLESVTIDYNNSDLQMQIIKPTDDSRNIKEVVKNIGDAKLIDFIKDKGYDYTAEVQLTMPEFKVSSDFDLVNTLKNQGITDIFDPSLPTFSNIFGTDTPSYASSVRQLVKMECNREGTKAAADTYMTATMTSAAPERKSKIDFTVDKPFMIVVSNRYTGEWVFIGYVQDVN